MLYTDAADIEFSKYNRLFVIGCSFTHWLWPTWADIIVKQHPHLEYHNFGMPGAGNDYIQTMLSQVSREFTLNKNDLVMIMWSSFHRDTAYSLYNNESGELAQSIIDNTPKTNVIKHCFNWSPGFDLIGQKLEKDTTSNISDGRGYLIKNLGIIDNVTDILKNAKYGSAQMLSSGITGQCKFDTTCVEYPMDDVLEFYSDIESYMLGDAYYEVLGYELDNIKWKDGEEDYHPKSIQYYNYLTYTGFNLDYNTEQWCKEADKHVQDTDYSNDLEDDAGWPYAKFPISKEFPL